MPFDSTPVTNPAIKTLQLGRSQIENGWCQNFGRLRTPAGISYCAVGAIDGDVGALVYLKRALPPGYPYVSNYNDNRSTTKADVLDLYDRAIELAVQDQLANGGK